MRADGFTVRLHDGARKGQNGNIPTVHIYLYQPICTKKAQQNEDRTIV